MSEGRGAVLVVDDDRLNRTMLAHSLDEEGYRTRTASDGEQALKMLDEDPFDVVLLDVLMPGMDGFEVLRRIKANPDRRHLPVIMVSALDDIDGVVKGIEMGAEDYLPKPFNPVLLRARVGACLSRKRLHDLEVEYRETVRRQAAELEALNRELTSRVQQQVGEIERLRRLRRFLSPQVAELLISSGDETVLEAHRQQISVLFCDLRGFTAFSETAAPEQVMSVLREFHERFGELVRRFEATVGFFAGDAVMVFFNDPLPNPDPAMQAIRMACALRQEMTALVRGWQKLDYDLDFGVGIALGYATLGQMGFQGRHDYTAIGPVVNLAARLCDRARNGADVVIDQLAYCAVEGRVEAEPLGRFELKGFSRARAAYRVLDVCEPAGEG